MEDEGGPSEGRTRAGSERARSWAHDGSLPLELLNREVLFDKTLIIGAELLGIRAVLLLVALGIKIGFLNETALEDFFN